MRLYATAYSFTKKGMYITNTIILKKLLEWVKVFRKTKVKLKKKQQK